MHNRTFGPYLPAMNRSPRPDKSLALSRRGTVAAASRRGELSPRRAGQGVVPVLQKVDAGARGAAAARGVEGQQIAAGARVRARRRRPHRPPVRFLVVLRVIFAWFGGFLFRIVLLGARPSLQCHLGARPSLQCHLACGYVPWSAGAMPLKP
jgi:hypothetical protein